MLSWLVSIADIILTAVFTFIGFFVLLWTFTMAVSCKMRMEKSFIVKPQILELRAVT